MDIYFAPTDTIPVRPMRQTAEVKNDSEDWTGVTSAKERRKLQNRLNQRAKRRKQRQQAEDLSPNPKTSNHDSKIPIVAEADLEALSITLGKLVLFTPQENNIAIRRRGQSKPYLVTVDNSPSTLETCNRLSQLAQQSYRQNGLGNPTHGHLTKIVHYNVFHGLARNAALMGLKNEWLIKGSISPLTRTSQSLISCPENMRLTDLQYDTPHHPWIDLFPLPRMRDNFLRAAQARKGTVDEDGMCRDIVDVGAGHGIEHAALVIWGDPWDPSAWEATEGFLRKWGWLLEGCEEILEGTNRWRRERGLRPFKFETGR